MWGSATAPRVLGSDAEGRRRHDCTPGVPVHNRFDDLVEEEEEETSGPPPLGHSDAETEPPMPPMWFKCGAKTLADASPM